MSSTIKGPIVAFGPNDTEKSSYFLFFPGEDPRVSGMHQDLAERMGGEGPSKKRAEFPYYLALWRDKMYVVGFRRRGEYEMSSDEFKVRYKPLHKWLEKNYKTRSFSETRIALGSGGSFWACSDVGYRWNELPPRLEEIMQGLLRPKGPKRELPTGAALGRDNSWVLTYENEPPRWSTDVQSYKVLWEILRQARESVTYVSMSALDKDLFFVLFADKSAMWCVPKAWSWELQGAADKYYERFDSQDIGHTLDCDIIARATSFSSGIRDNLAYARTHVDPRPGRSKENKTNMSRAKSR